MTELKLNRQALAYRHAAVFRCAGRCFLPALCALLLVACGGLSPRQAQQASPSGTENTAMDAAGRAAPASADAPATAPDAANPASASASADKADDGRAEAGIPDAGLDEDLLFNLLTAEFAGNAGDIDTAVKYYNRAADQVADKRIAARAVYIALYGKDYPEALAALKRWDALDPGDEEVRRLYAVIYLKLHEVDKSVHYIEAILGGSGATPHEQALALKTMLGKEADTDDARAVLEKINQGPLRSSPMLILQARYEAQLKHYDQALALLDEVGRAEPDRVDVLMIKARILAAQGKTDEALGQIRAIVEQQPDNHALRLQYAQLLVEQSRLKEALAQYRILHKQLPDNDEVIASLALLSIEANDLDTASTMLHKLLDMGKRGNLANYYLGRIAQGQGERKQAIAYFLRVKSREYAFDAQLRIAALMAELGRVDEALLKLEMLADAQTLWARKLRVYLTEGDILRQQKRYAEAVELYSRALQEKRNDPNLLYARGLMAEKIDRIDMTEADLRKVIAQEPNNANALNALGYTLADRTSRYKEALKYILRASELLPDDPAILDSLGWVNYRLGKLHEAEKWLARAFAKMEDPEIAAHYGEVLWMLNRKDKAREIWRRGQQLDARHPVLVETLQRLNPGKLGASADAAGVTP